jgi:hypothetical protein
MRRSWSRAAAYAWAPLLVCSLVPFVGGLAFAQTPGVGLLKIADHALPGKFSPDADLNFDPDSNRPYLADPAAGALHVFDTTNRTFTRSVFGLPGVDQLLAVLELDRLYATTAADSSVTVIDTDTLSILGRITNS